jgi:hypothetical protein
VDVERKIPRRKREDLSASLDGLVDELRDAARELDALVARSGLSGQFTSTYRSRTEQERLYRAYISGRHHFPVAPPGSSAHEYGEAFDYLVRPAEYQRDVGLVWVEWGGEWGGDADVVHFELPGASARAIQRGKNLIAEAAAKYGSLPWWATIALPSSLMVEELKPGDFTKSPALCRTFGIFC